MIATSFLFGQFLGGLTTAMFLFLIASGLSLVFGVMGVRLKRGSNEFISY